jgi:hypothetical protein
MKSEKPKTTTFKKVLNDVYIGAWENYDFSKDTRQAFAGSITMVVLSLAIAYNVVQNARK